MNLDQLEQLLRGGYFVSGSNAGPLTVDGSFEPFYSRSSIGLRNDLLTLITIARAALAWRDAQPPMKLGTTGETLRKALEGVT